MLSYANNALNYKGEYPQWNKAGEKQRRAGAAEGPSARVLSKKTPPSCTSKVLPQLKGWAPSREMGLRLHNRVRYLLHGENANLHVRCVLFSGFRKMRTQHRRSKTGVTVGDLWSGFLDNPPTEAHLSDFCFKEQMLL